MSELDVADTDTQDHAVAKLAYVGDARAVRQLARLLKRSEQRGKRRASGSKEPSFDGDAAPPELNLLAVKALATIVPEGEHPVKLSRWPTKKEIRKWQAWWDKNKSKYEK